MALLKILLAVFLIKIVSGFECGERKVEEGTALSANGKPTYAGQWPWLVALFKVANESFANDESKWVYLCGGTLLNSRTVLTAAHCFKDDDKQVTEPMMRVIIGRYNITNQTDPNGVVKNVFRRVFGPNYTLSDGITAPKSLSDIGILKLKDEVEFSDYIQPICLPTLSQEVLGVRASTPGYGRNKTSSNKNDFQRIARYVEITTIDLNTCLTHNTFSSKIVSNKSLCTQEKDVTLCQGDSGSGLFIKNEKNQKWTILGVVSHAFDTECSPGKVNVFSRVSMYIDWIRENAVGELFFANEFRCKNGTEIVFTKKCDGNDDCGDGSDESECIKGSSDSSTFTAQDRQIIKSNFTIHHKLSLTITKFKMFDSREAYFLPTKVSEIFPKLQEYHVEWCKIKEVYDDSFVSLSELRILSLSENVIEKISEKAFDDLGNLEILNLDHNYLTTLPENIFGRLGKLKQLDLCGNKFLSFHDKLFTPLKVLKELNLKHNEIQTLNGNNFVELKNITTILLFGNEIDKIKNGEIFKNLTALTELDLGANNCVSKKLNAIEIKAENFAKLCRKV